jgi:RloB-like protein
MPRFPKRKIRLQSRKEKLKEDSNLLLIICEGKTEEVYFKEIKRRIRDSRLNIIPIDEKGTHPTSLFEQAEKYKVETGINLRKGDKVWIVFDKDSNTQHDIDTIVERSRKSLFDLGFSNPSFELWFLLHFDYITHRIDNDDLKRRLKRFIPGYDKGCCYNDLLFPKQEDASRHAMDLIRFHKGDRKNPYNDESNPVTHVGKLVKFITEF